MTSLSEQLSAVRKSQWEAQLDVLRALSSRALDNTEQLIALNMKTSRASMEQAAGAFKQMLDVRDPRDLFAVGAAAQNQWQHLFSYGRELLGIAAGAQVRGWSIPPVLQLIPAPTANIPASVSQVMEQAAIATADATTVASEIAAAAADSGNALAQATLQAGSEAGAARPQAPDETDAPAAPAPQVSELDAEKTGADPAETPQHEGADQAPVGTKDAAAALDDAEAAIESAIADEVPPAKAKPLARALNEVAPKSAAVEHPIVSTVPLEVNGHVELPVVPPAERPAPLQAPAREARSARASRKK